jgi:Protein of unknown function (DUF2934)
MATTRSRTGTSRSKKSAKTTATNDAQSQSPGQNVPPGGAEAGVPEVTGATLERREIPSFSESREARIAEAAYWRAERRGFSSGHELDDWLEAEREIDGATGSQSGGRS